MIDTYKLALTPKQIDERLQLLDVAENCVEIQAKKITALAQTAEGDADNTLTTKSYVDSKPTIYSGNYDPNQRIDEDGDFGKDGDIFIRYS